MNKTIIWTKRARSQRKEILKYWINHNKSNTYSSKLNTLFGLTTDSLSIHPELGRITEMENIRQKIIKSYKLFYKVIESEIFIIALVDMRRDPEEIRKMLK